MSITLECPLCAAVVADSVDALGPGRCPACRARFEGDGDHPVTGTAAALTAYEADDLDAQEVATALFSIEPGSELATLVGVASDSRDGFYRWWVFARDDGMEPAERLRALVRG